MNDSKIFKIEDGMLTMFDWNEFNGNVAGVATAYDYKFMEDYDYDVSEFEEADVVIECANPLSMRKFIALCYAHQPEPFHVYWNMNEIEEHTDQYGDHLALPMLTSEDCSIVHVSKIVVERFEVVVNGEALTIFNCQQRYYFKAECSQLRYYSKDECSEELCRVQVKWNVIQDGSRTSITNGECAMPFDLRRLVLE
ncbi:MAG: hypothetical protein ACKOW2_01380 [Sphingobacteriaceae bacterium]